MVGEIAEISAQLGVPLWLFSIILIWTAIWKLLGMWKAAQKKSVIWFIVLGVVNTVGILPLLYIYVFSEMKLSKKKKRKK
jgi:hypothetical protein